MGTREDWRSLSARIVGLVDACHLASDLLTAGNDSVGAMVDLGNHEAAILSDLRAFGESLDKSSGFAREAIQRVATKAGPMLSDRSSSTEMRQIYIRSALVMLAALEGELSYLLRDDQDSIRNRSERAFEHLRRSIVVDKHIGEIWRNAFANGEVECERLGAVHLLSHGIWAFKVNAAGGRTDLVYQEPLTDSGLVKRTADGLVLTEWKKLPDGDDRADRWFEDARGQAQRYATGVLAGTELTHYRYAVLVSRRDERPPDDVEVNGTIYRHINVPVEPRSPSKA